MPVGGQLKLKGMPTRYMESDADLMILAIWVAPLDHFNVLLQVFSVDL